MKYRWREKAKYEGLLTKSIRQMASASAQIEDIPVTSEQLKQWGLEELLWRRQEIIGIIRDHPYCTFDFIYRRFVNQVSSKSVHNDLLILQIKGYIIKAGKTRGATYLVHS